LNEERKKHPTYLHFYSGAEILFSMFDVFSRVIMNFSKKLAARSALNDPSVDDISENIQLTPFAWPGHCAWQNAAAVPSRVH
jgi:hypothetical protein